MFFDDDIRIDQALFDKICRASPEQARTIALTLPGDVRARLALFCNARGHLRAAGRAIAASCALNDLVSEGGHAGLVLHGQIDAGPDTFGDAQRRRA